MKVQHGSAAALPEQRMGLTPGARPKSTANLLACGCVVSNGVDDAQNVIGVEVRHRRGTAMPQQGASAGCPGAVSDLIGASGRVCNGKTAGTRVEIDECSG